MLIITNNNSYQRMQYTHFLQHYRDKKTKVNLKFWSTSW